MPANVELRFLFVSILALALVAAASLRAQEAAAAEGAAKNQAPAVAAPDTPGAPTLREGVEGLAGLRKWVTSIAVSRDGGLIAVGGGETLLIRPGATHFFDGESGKLLGGFEPHSSTVWSVAISPDGERRHAR
jgi:hypothetical protein